MRIVMFALAVLLLARPAAAAPFRWEQPKVWEVAPLVAADALIWIDVAQTRAFMRRGTPDANPLLGNRPSEGRAFWVGGVLSTLAMVAVWYALPGGWRIAAPAAVVGAECDAIAHNAMH